MNTFTQIKLYAGKMNANHVRLMWFLLTLTLLVIGAGAPEGQNPWTGN